MRNVAKWACVLAAAFVVGNVIAFPITWVAGPVVGTLVGFTVGGEVAFVLASFIGLVSE